MARQYSMVASFPPINLFAPAADSAGRTGAYASLRNAEKAWIQVVVNQGASNTVLLSVLQAQDSSGTGSKAVSNAVPIWLQADSTASDAYVVQTAATTFTTSSATKNKTVIFEITPETALDMANGFNHITVSTGSSSASNITFAQIIIWGSFQAATPPTSIV